MDFRTLTYFITVAQELNFTRAAEKLNMSQPPLSNQIKELERDLGAPLFIRGKRQLKLTPAGAILQRRAAQILELGTRTREEISSLGKELSGNLALGTVEGRAPFLAARWIVGFKDEFPLVTYTLRNGSSDDILEQLYRGIIDLAIIATPYDTEHLDGMVVGTEPWVALIPASHELAEMPGNELPLRLLADQPLIIPERKSRIEAVRRWFGQIDVEPRILCTLSNYTDAVALVEQGAGISIFPQTTYTPNQHVVSKVITDPAKIAQFVLVKSKEHPLSALAQAFWEYVEDFLAQDQIHSARFHVKEEEFDLPQGADIL